MVDLNEAKCREELGYRGWEVQSFTLKKQDDFKFIAEVDIVKNKDEESVNALPFSACLKVYDTNKFEQIERIYTVLHLLATKLKDEAKKKNESFINLLPIIYKTWKEEELLYVLEEKIEGKTLAERVIHNEYKTFSAFVQVTKQICDAVAMLHQPFPPIVHCDIKEANIIIDSDDHVVKIIDFDSSYIEGSGSYNIVRSTKGYRPTEMVNSAPVSQSDIYAIGCIMENMIKCSDWKHMLDSQCNEKLNQIIIKSKEELSRRYYDVNELKVALSEVEILYMLQRQMNKLDDKDSFNVYSYTNDRNGQIDSVKNELIDYTDVDILYVAIRDTQKLAFSMTGVYFIDGKVKEKKPNIEYMSYDELIACVRENKLQESSVDTLNCITKTFAGQWKKIVIDLPSDATELVCETLNNIVLFKNSYYSIERIADYYSNKCCEVNDILISKELEGKRHELEIWWDLVIILGNLACEKEEVCGKERYTCNNILLKVYGNRRADLRHELSENKDYDNQILVDRIIDCYKNETKFGSEDADVRMQEFLEKLESKRKGENSESAKSPKMLEGFAKHFTGKKG